MTAASSSLRGSSVPGLPLMVLPRRELLHRGVDLGEGQCSLRTLWSACCTDPSWLHIYLLPAALLGTRALHQNDRACPGAGPYALTIIRIKKPGLNQLYCGGVSKCTMSKNLRRRPSVEGLELVLYKNLTRPVTWRAQTVRSSRCRVQCAPVVPCPV